MLLEEGPTGSSSGFSIALADKCWLVLLLALFSSRTRFSFGKLVVSTMAGFYSSWHSDLTDCFLSSETFRLSCLSLMDFLLGVS